MMAHTSQEKRKVKNKTASSMQEQTSTQNSQTDSDPNIGDDQHNRIAEYAFFMYAEGGFQHGHDLDHWLEAERRVFGH